MSVKLPLRRAFALALSVLSTVSVTASLAAVHAPAIAPLEAGNYAKPGAQQLIAGETKHSSMKSKFAHIAAAAVCTEDLATISFPEYTVDWTSWLQEVGTRWSHAMNSRANGDELCPSSPMFLEFTCNRDGSISEIVVDRSSGDVVVDSLQIKTLLRCMPLPPFPAESRKKNITLLCIWSYRNHAHIAKTSHRKYERPVIRVSISGAQI